MNRFDNAVIDLLSAAPPASAVDALRTRTRRRRRRTVAVVALVGVVSLASVGVAASLGHNSSNPRISIQPPTTLSTAQQAWCVPITRQTAIASAMGFRSEATPGNTARAKLMSAPEYPESPGASVATSVPVNGPQLVWVVEITGSVYPAFAHDVTSPAAWDISEFDARTGDIVSDRAGPGAPPAYWNALPDHSSQCPADNAVTPTSAPGPTTTASGVQSRPAPTPPPCSPHQTVPTMNGSFCGPTPGPGNGLGPSGECTGRESAPPCGAGMVPGRYYAYTLPGSCDGRLILDGRHWISELPPPNPVPPMHVWVSIDAAGTHAGFISPSGSVGFDPDHGQPAGKCTSP